MTKKTPWEKALDKFLQDWRRKKYVLGAMLTGSYAMGSPTRYSDIDIVIILRLLSWRYLNDLRFELNDIIHLRDARLDD